MSKDNKPKRAHKIWSFFIPGTLDNYCISLALPTFIVALGIILAALMLARLLVLLDLLASDNSPLSTFLGLLADLVPHYLGLAVPAALCVAIFSSVRQLSLNNEIDALLSSGISLFRMSRAYTLTGVVISVLCIILYGYIQPYARYDFRAALYYASHAGWVPNIQSHTIVAPDSHVVMIVDKASQHGTHLSGVFIRQVVPHKDSKPTEHIILAKTGNFYTADNRTKIRLDMQNGQTLTLNAHNGNNITDFSESSKEMTQKGKKVTYRNRGDDERELTITELYQQLQHHTMMQIKLLDIKAEFHFRLVRSLSILGIPILATGLAIMKKRKRRSWGVVIAAITLVACDHIQQLGQEFVASGHHSPFSALWLPLLAFFLMCYTILIAKSGLLRFSTIPIFKRSSSPTIRK